MPKLTEKLKNLINDGELDLALEVVEKQASKNIKMSNAICLFKAKYEKLKIQQSSNSIDYGDYKAKKLELSKALDNAYEKLLNLPNTKEKINQSAEEKIQITLHGKLQNLDLSNLEAVLEKIQEVLNIRYPIKLENIQGTGVVLIVLLEKDDVTKLAQLSENKKLSPELEKEIINIQLPPISNTILGKIDKFFKDLWNWFWALGIWKRVILGSAIGGLTGSAVIGFFNKQALYYHAYYEEFRIPVEGVEYVNLAVSLISFIHIIFSVFGAVTIYWVLTKVYNLFKDILESNNMSQRKKNWIATAVVLITALITIPILGFFDRQVIFMSSIFCTLAVTVIFFLRTKQKRKVGATVAVFIGIVFITGFLFYQPFYKGFLRTIKYGGEIPIEIQYRKADNTEVNLKGLLLIRTQKNITIKNEKTLNQEEVPMNRVSKIVFLKNKAIKEDTHSKKTK